MILKYEEEEVIEDEFEQGNGWSDIQEKFKEGTTFFSVLLD